MAEIQSEIRILREIQWISKSRTPRRAVADPSDEASQLYPDDYLFKTLRTIKLPACPEWGNSCILASPHPETVPIWCMLIPLLYLDTGNCCWELLVSTLVEQKQLGEMEVWNNHSRSGHIPHLPV